MSWTLVACLELVVGFATCLAVLLGVFRLVPPHDTGEIRKGGIGHNPVVPMRITGTPMEPVIERLSDDALLDLWSRIATREGWYWRA